MIQFGTVKPRYLDTFSLFAAIIVVFSISACSTLSSPLISVTQSIDKVGSCELFFAQLQNEIDQYQVNDVQEARIKGYPYLRTNRFLASLKEEFDDSQFFELGDPDATACQYGNRHLRNRMRDMNMSNKYEYEYGVKSLLIVLSSQFSG